MGEGKFVFPIVTERVFVSPFLSVRQETTWPSVWPIPICLSEQNTSPSGVEYFIFKDVFSFKKHSFPLVSTTQKNACLGWNGGAFSSQLLGQTPPARVLL